MGKEIERELCDEVDHPREDPKPAQHLTVGIDGAFVKARRSAAGERRQFEILTGRIERQRGRGEVFSIVTMLTDVPSRKCKRFCDTVIESPKLTSPFCPMAKMDCAA